MTDDDLIEKISVLRIRRGDVLVVRAPSVLSIATVAVIKATVQEALAQAGAWQVPVVVMDSSMTLELVQTAPGVSEGLR